MKTIIKNLLAGLGRASHAACVLSALVVGFGLILSDRAAAQTFTTLYNFTDGSDGADPSSGLVLSGNTLYGTVGGGIDRAGTVFAINTNGSNFTTLYSFTNGTDGLFPGGLILSGNTLYGTTTGDLEGATPSGTVFAVNTNGTGFRTLHGFTAASSSSPINSDGGYPEGRLVLSGNTLYGTAAYGGLDGVGTVFAVNTNGTGFMNLHSFGTVNVANANIDGAYPDAGLILSGNTLYGMAVRGGSLGFGTLFALNTDGSGFTNLYDFTGGSDGRGSTDQLILSGNTFYGTTQTGGSSSNGTVFAVNKDGTGFTNLHSFTAGHNYTNGDGANPIAGLILSGNTLYGTASDGGSFNFGTVFAVSTNGTGFKTLHSFGGPSGGDGDPYGAVYLSGSTLYGTESFLNGAVFALSANIVQIMASPSVGVTPLTVNLNSSGVDNFGHAITSWNWNFGDGSTSTAQNPSHVYTAAGTFAPLLVATNSLGVSVPGSGPSITVSPRTIAFIANPTNGVVPLTVSFTSADVDSTGNAISRWNWNFGDGSTSAAQNPSHTYATNGAFAPALIATNSIGDTVTGSGPASITANVNFGLVLNGGFETGDFTDWTLSGDTSELFVDDGSVIIPYSGNYAAALGTFYSTGYLSQTLSTAVGVGYLLSFWVENPYENPGEFRVSWNGDILLDTTNLEANDWTNMQFVVSATAISTILQFRFQDDDDYFGLDAISVFPAQPGIASLSLSGANLVLNGINGLSGGTYYLLMSTNLALPLNEWTQVATNVLSASGNFTITATNTVTPSVPQRFYILETQ